MRQIVIAAAMALGLIALWAAILPLTAQPALPSAHAATTAAMSTAPTSTVPTSTALSKALFLCRGEHGIDRACAASLAKALVLEAGDHTPTQASDRSCHADPQVLASTDHHD
jgi:hypothetical protein